MRKFLKVGLDTQFYESLQKNAADNSISLSAFVRKILKDGKIVQRDNNSSYILYHLNKIGNNLNQIAKKINSEDYRNIDTKIYQLLVDIKKYCSELSDGHTSK